MPRLNFGAFLAPHHPIGEHPMLQFRRDLDLVEHLDKLGYDEFWCGEHHSSGWEMIGSPEMFLAAAGERSKRIKLATGVVSLPYHHPFNVAQRMVQLDYMTGGRAIFGSGPGRAGLGRPHARHRSDAAARPPGRGHRRHPPPVPRRARHAQVRLVHAAGRRAAAAAAAGGDAVRRRLPDQPLGHDPGRQARHRRHLDRVAVGGRAERAADAVELRRGRRRQARPDRRPQELARAAELAHRRDAREGPRRGARRPAAAPQRVHHRDAAAARARGRSQTPTRPWTRPRSSPAPPPRSARRTIWWRGSSRCSRSPAASAPSSASSTTGPTRRTPCAAGTWWRATWCRRSTATWPGCAQSREFVANNREYFDRAREAVMAKITENEAAAAALAVTKSPLLAASSSNVPDLDQARAS